MSSTPPKPKNPNNRNSISPQKKTKPPRLNKTKNSTSGIEEKEDLISDDEEQTSTTETKEVESIDITETFNINLENDFNRVLNRISYHLNTNIFIAEMCFFYKIALAKKKVLSSLKSINSTIEFINKTYYVDEDSLELKTRFKQFNLLLNIKHKHSTLADDKKEHLIKYALEYCNTIIIGNINTIIKREINKNQYKIETFELFVEHLYSKIQLLIENEHNIRMYFQYIEYSSLKVNSNELNELFELNEKIDSIKLANDSIPLFLKVLSRIGNFNFNYNTKKIPLYIDNFLIDFYIKMKYTFGINNAVYYYYNNKMDLITGYDLSSHSNNEIREIYLFSVHNRTLLIGNANTLNKFKLVTENHATEGFIFLNTEVHDLNHCMKALNVVYPDHLIDKILIDDNVSYKELDMINFSFIKTEIKYADDDGVISINNETVDLINQIEECKKHDIVKKELDGLDEKDKLLKEFLIRKLDYDDNKIYIDNHIRVELDSISLNNLVLCMRNLYYKYSRTDLTLFTNHDNGVISFNINTYNALKRNYFNLKKKNLYLIRLIDHLVMNTDFNSDLFADVFYLYAKESFHEETETLKNTEFTANKYYARKRVPFNVIKQLIKNDDRYDLEWNNDVILNTKKMNKRAIKIALNNFNNKKPIYSHHIYEKVIPVCIRKIDKEILKRPGGSLLLEKIKDLIGSMLNDRMYCIPAIHNDDYVVFHMSSAYESRVVFFNARYEIPVGISMVFSASDGVAERNDFVDECQLVAQRLFHCKTNELGFHMSYYKHLCNDYTLRAYWVVANLIEEEYNSIKNELDTKKSSELNFNFQSTFYDFINQRIWI